MFARSLTVPGFALRILAATTMLVAAVLLSACGPDSRAEDEASRSDRPRVLRIGWVPNDEDVERRARWEGLVDYLERRLEMRVELVQTASYSPAIEALRAKKLEIVGLAPFAYLIASQKGLALPLVAAGTADGAPRAYRSGFIVPKDSPLRTLDDVKAHASSITFSWADPASTSGHLVPRAHLESLGIHAERDFKRAVFAMNHTASILTVKAGKVDLAAVTTTSLQNMITKGRIAADDVRLIWESEPIMASIIAIRADLPEAFRAEILAAYLAFADEDPEAWERIAPLYLTEGVRWVAAHDRDFDALRVLARNVEHLELLGE
ncbi:putative selenate ABC transporter substrate-binding protein [Opitutales bacterium ASA1]|uniref:phosphate/phosphite/phosphonate ABC transporter substrate-binding protein n=1 Tax=Congregicoccus parvus TaxID=3081749 RepID=UPI002B2E2367|nr:putative selenate ABC transporter substrate-binding protein [Opitutales bacterium ASA1]